MEVFHGPYTSGTGAGHSSDTFKVDLVINQRSNLQPTIHSLLLVLPSQNVINTSCTFQESARKT